MIQMFFTILGVVALCFAGIALRIILKKGGEFRGTCASNNPMLKNEVGECSLCGKKPDEECQNPEVA